MDGAVTVAMHIVGEHGTATKEFHYEILNNARLSPLAMMATVFNALHGTNEYGEDITHRMNGVFSVKGYPDVTLRNTFAPQDNVTAALTAFGKVYLRGRKSIRKKRTISAAGRKRIAAAQRARWARVRAQK